MSRPLVATPGGWRAIALCGAFVAGVCLAAMARPSLLLCVAVLAAGAGDVALRWATRRPAVLLPLLAGAACAVGLARGSSTATQDTAWAAATGHGPAVLLGTVREGTGSRRSGNQVVVDVDRVVHSEGDTQVHVAVLATPRGAPRVLPGDRVRLDVGGLRPPGGSTPGAILEREGIDAVAQSPTLTVQEVGGFSPARAIAVVRDRLASTVDAALPEPAAALVEAIVFGIRRPLSADLTAALQDAGLAHVLAISGLKVVLVAAVLTTLCGMLAVSPRVRMLLTATAVSGYVVLCGATPAAVRSALMAGAGWGLQGTGRSPDPLPLLALTAAAMLLIDPGLCRDTGFQLSFLGTLGIVVLAPPLAGRLPGPRLFREPFATTLAAQLVTLPVMAATFGVVSLVGPLANALGVPLLPPLIVAGALGAVVAVLLPAVATAALAPAAGLVLLLAAIATRAAALPMAALHVAAWPRVAVVVELASIAAAATVWLVLRRRFAATPLSALGPAEVGATAPVTSASLRSGTDAPAPSSRRAAFTLSRRSAAALAGTAALATGAAVLALSGRPDGLLHVAVLDVGAARAVAVRTATGDDALVDTGSDPQRLLESLGTALPPLTRSLGLLVLTGGDRAAVGGLPGLADRYHVDRVVVPGDGLGSAARTTLASLADRGAAVVSAPPGTAWTWGGATWRFLDPDGAADEGTALSITDPTGRLLLLGNLTVAAQEELTALQATALRAELLVTPPSGAVAPALLDAVRPRLVAVPDARAARGRSSTSLLTGPGVRHTAQGGTLTYIGSEGGLLAT